MKSYCAYGMFKRSNHEQQEFWNNSKIFCFVFQLSLQHHFQSINQQVENQSHYCWSIFKGSYARIIHFQIRFRRNAVKSGIWHSSVVWFPHSSLRSPTFIGAKCYRLWHNTHGNGQSGFMYFISSDFPDYTLNISFSLLSFSINMASLAVNRNIMFISVPKVIPIYLAHYETWKV